MFILDAHRDPILYKKLLNESLLTAIFFVFALSLVLGFVKCGKIALPFVTSFGNIKKSLEAIPNFTVEKGKIHVDGQMPMKMLIGKTMYVIDTSKDNFSDEDFQKETNAIFVSKTALVLSKNTTRKILNLSPYLSFSKTTLMKFFKKPLWYIIGFLVLICASFLFTCLIYAVILFILSSVLLKLLNIHNDHKSMLKYSLYCVLVPALIHTVSYLFGKNLPFSTLIYFVIGLIHMWFIFELLSHQKEEVTLTL